MAEYNLKTQILLNDGDIVVEMGGILNLNGGQIVRNNGSPTLELAIEVLFGNTMKELLMTYNVMDIMD